MTVEVFFDPLLHCDNSSGYLLEILLAIIISREFRLIQAFCLPVDGPVC